MRALWQLLHRGDLDELVREVDRRSARGDHHGVLELRDGCLELTAEHGRQLWGPAQYAEYRLALEAPAPLAAGVVQPGAGRFALGPLTEVVAQHHDFEGLAGHLAGPVRPVVAQERILRGEDLTHDPRAALDDTGLPGRLQPWEPVYALPTYRAVERLDGAPSPAVGPPRRAHPHVAPPSGEGPVAAALREVVAPWQDESSGQVRLQAVAGDGDAAVRALVGPDAELVALTPAEAMSRLGWAGASGGALGRRRGGAAGRAAAWWVAHAATGLDFPAEADELEFHLEELEWLAFAAGDADAAVGWRLRMAVTDGDWAVAIDAHDRAGTPAHAADPVDGRYGDR